MNLDLVGDTLTELLVGDERPGTINAQRRWPSWAGDGALEFLELQPGVLLWISDFTPATDIRMCGSREDGYLSFSYYLRGGLRIASAKLSHALDIDEGHHQIGVSAPGEAGVGFFDTRRRSVIVSLSLSKAAAADLVATPDTAEAESWLRALERERSYVWAPREMTDIERGIATQIAACPFAGRARQLFLESKVLELLAHAMARTNVPSAALRLCREDEARIRTAAALLLDRFDRPPSIRELARVTGVNELKLKRGFRQLFGTTPFGYIRLHRMTEAYGLLARGEVTVGEAAWRVGYQCPSRFTVAFRRQFGMTPSSVKTSRSIS
jgi:AraC family transcriptional activator of pyochelin receptor